MVSRGYETTVAYMQPRRGISELSKTGIKWRHEGRRRRCAQKDMMGDVSIRMHGYREEWIG